MRPSLYPTPASPSPVPSPTSGAPSAPQQSQPPPDALHRSETLPPDYEVLLDVFAVVSQSAAAPHPHPSLDPPQPEAPLRVLQGPLAESDNPTATPNPAYHAFISTRDINIPLLPTTVVSPLPSPTPSPRPTAFRVALHDRVFVVTLNPRTEPELVDGFAQILKWFCHWQTTPVASADHAEQLLPHSHQQPATSNDRFGALGDAGVRFVEKTGQAIHAKIQRNISARTEAARSEPTRDVKMGGKVTSTVLGSARKVVGAGASLASKATGKISDMVGNGMSNNTVTRSLSEAPEGSLKKRFHNNLMSGLLAFGRIYVAADTQGKIIIESAGNSTAELASLKYGPEAGQASRHVAGIALDGYRIARFPHKLGATSLVKGAFKSKFARDAATVQTATPDPAVYQETFASDPTPSTSQQGSVPRYL